MDSEQDTACAVGCPIRRSRDHRSLASPPGFSQRATSFIASQCQGIHQMPLLCASRATPNGKSQSGRQSFSPTEPGFDPSSAYEDTYREPSRSPRTNPRSPRRVSRLGHTTRFFTMSRQHAPGALDGRPGQTRCFMPCPIRGQFGANSGQVPGGLHAGAPGLVEVIGLEPTTPCLQSRCSPS